MRERLPDRRDSLTQKFKIIALDSSPSLYVTVGFKPDGAVGEVKIVLSSTGSTERAYTDALSFAVSIGLQNGANLADYVEQFIGSKFMPFGPIRREEGSYPHIRMCSSPLDLAFRWLGIEFCGMDDLKAAPMPPVQKMRKKRGFPTPTSTDASKT